MWSFVWLLFRSMIFSRFIHAIACIRTSFFLWMNIPLSGSITLYLSIHQLMDLWVISTFGLLSIMLWTFLYKFSCGIVGHMVTLFHLLRNPRSFYTKSKPPFLVLYFQSPLSLSPRSLLIYSNLGTTLGDLANRIPIISPSNLPGAISLSWHAPGRQLLLP